ncbi:MAG: diacylglycerol kinase family lipid kinase [Candidatus Omnitrophica bacterium]|nr:diacylglycerol kinase family lipid kinase [Candidatus Omnitrophota bacterium]
MKKILFIVNPVAFAGRGYRAWQRFQALWPEQIKSKDMALTQKTGQAREIAACAKNYDIIVAVGGDGTANEVASGIMDRQPPRPALAIVPIGTGNDFAHTVGVRSLKDALSALEGGQRKSHDLIKIDCHVNGKPACRYSFLFCGVGFAAALLAILKPWMKLVFGPKGAYYFATLLSLFAYKPPQMKIKWADKEQSGRTWVVIAGNAQWAGGGGMKICPGALTDDGELNIVIVPARAKTEIISEIAKMADGSYIKEKGILYFPAKEIEVESKPQARLGIDGDVFGTTPAKIKVCPRAIEIISLA